MEIIVKIKEIDYSGMAQQLISVIGSKAEELKKEYPPLKMLLGNGLPGKRIGMIMKMIPINIKNLAVATLITRNQEGFIKVINDFVTSHKIALVVNDLKVKGEGNMININVKIDEIDYENIAEQVLPAALEKLKGYDGDNVFIKAISKMDHVPAGLAKTILSILPQEAKDDLVIDFIGSYKEGLIQQINGFIEKKHLTMSVADVSIS